MAEPSSFSTLTSTFCLLVGWIAISHTVVRNLASQSTSWRETGLDATVLSIGIMSAAVGLRGFLSLSEKKKTFNTGSDEGLW
jgi:hypothetical protein